MHFIQKSATGALGLSRGAVRRRDGIFLRTEDPNPMGSHACASHATRGAVGAAQGARRLARLKLLSSHANPRHHSLPPSRRAPRRDPPRGGPYASRCTIHRGETPHGSSGTARASGAAAHLSAAGARRFPRRRAPRARAPARPAPHAAPCAPPAAVRRTRTVRGLVWGGSARWCGGGGVRCGFSVCGSCHTRASSVSIEVIGDPSR